jgi:signal transduction histidine kinase
MRARFDVNKSVIKVEGDFVCFPRAVTFCSSYEPTSLRVDGDHTEFERALINIIENACSAVAASDDPQIKLTAKAGTDFVEVIIADNGHGMTEETRQRIFESGFTTKTQRPNHGLGLAITAKIVAALGGTITCESEPGKGASFRMRLPAS